MNKRALITGVTGMVGSHLSDFLLDNTDWDVYGICRWRSPLDNVEHLIPRANDENRIFFDYADLLDIMSLYRVIKKVEPDYIFHLAAQSYPQTSFTESSHTLQTNVVGTNNLLSVVKELNQNPIIHVCSSSEVFGKVTKENIPINEENHFQPASPYAISKVGTDLLGQFYAQAYSMNIQITRMFTHTGPRRGDVFAESTFAKQIALIEDGQIPPTIKVGNLNSMRTWADVRDAVRAYYMLVTINPIPGEYYNIGGDYSCTVGEMLDYLISLSSCKDSIQIEREETRMRPVDADLQIPDTTKFKKHTGWEPEITFEQTMEDLLNYWREQIGKGRKFLAR